ncbi:hypothetical protein ACJX0J_038250, partial [Zea mays]
SYKINLCFFIEIFFCLAFGKKPNFGTQRGDSIGGEQHTSLVHHHMRLSWFFYVKCCSYKTV